MTETARKRRASAPLTAARSPGADDAERALGRAFALGVPAVSALAALVVGIVGSVGSALLVLASGTLLGAIVLLWASVRTLGGDAPLPVDLELQAAQVQPVDDLGERKRRALRAIRDLESEHVLGKLDDADYEAFVARYREEAKSVMREMDARIAPMRERAERMAREYVERQEKSALDPEPPRRSETPAVKGEERTRRSEAAAAKGERVACPACSKSNEVDAAFCKSCGTAMRPAEKDES
jgi:hypothetical protein